MAIEGLVEAPGEQFTDLPVKVEVVHRKRMSGDYLLTVRSVNASEFFKKDIPVTQIVYNEFVQGTIGSLSFKNGEYKLTR